jgi:hypothetical protein
MADDIQIKGATGDTGTGSAKTPAQSTPPKPLKAGSISLDDEAVMSDQQMMAPGKMFVPQMVRISFPI